jgi:hypothetical protein
MTAHTTKLFKQLQLAQDLIPTKWFSGCYFGCSACRFTQLRRAEIILLPRSAVLRANAYWKNRQPSPSQYRLSSM